MILEVGTFIGKTAQTMAEALRHNNREDSSLPLGHIYTVDKKKK